MRKLSKTLLAALLLFGTTLPAQAQNYGRDVAVGDGEVFVSEPASATRAGIVYIYRPGAGGEWAESAQLTAPNAEANDGFGSALAVDGTTLLSSRPGTDEIRGAVYVFERDGESWRRTGALPIDGAQMGDRVGVALALDGATALVGVRNAADSAAAAVHVFERGADGEWMRTGELTGSDAQFGDRFGAALALRGDRAVVGAPAQADNRGAAYLFERGADGAWTEVAKMVSRTVSEDSRLGTSVAFVGDRVGVAAPGRDESTGAIYIFEPVEDGDGEWGAYTRLFPFDGGPRSQFGASMAMVDGELWAGSPGADGFAGTIYRLRPNEALDDWTAAGKFGFDELTGRSAFGAVFDVGADVAAVSMPFDDNGAGTVGIFTRDPMGEWMLANKVWSEPANFAAVRGGQVDCSDGSAAAWECSEVDLVSFVPVQDLGGERGISMNDVWGWTDPATGKEYALAGLTNATAFVDISDPENPVFLGELPMTEGSNVTTWRDIKTYRNHAYVVADNAGEHGMQVFDLTRLRDVDEDGAPVTFDADVIYDNVTSAHNVVINTETGFAYIVGAGGGGESCGGGLHMVDIRNPKSPRFAGCFADPQTGRASTGYSHDAQCVVYEGPDEDYAGHEICLGSNETAFSIADVTDKENPVAIARASYPNVGYTHQGWLTDDHRYFYMNDELDEIQGLVHRTRTMIWDIADLDDPQLVGTFMGTTESIDHNLYIKGDVMYQSDYVSGLRVIDISDRENPEEVGYFDTVPYGDNSPSFDGSWSNYPFFESGVVIMTSDNEGLFLVKVRKPVT